MRLVAEATKRRDFNFFRPIPPLSDLKFSDLSPSKTARMEMTSLFADIDGFTSFVDKAIIKGSNAIKTAATAIHVIREELNDVLKEDFGGKRLVNGRAACVCGRINKNGKLKLRRKCWKANDDCLPIIEAQRRSEEKAFWRALIGKQPCCGTMDNCPLK